MEFVRKSNDTSKYGPGDPRSNPKDLYTQLGISVLLGLSAFLSFCYVRTRWKGLYAARKRQAGTASSLPDLPDTFFGWIPALYRITQEEVLASSGLDAFVLLTFFHTAIKFLSIALFLSIVIIFPVHSKFLPDFPGPLGNHTSGLASQFFSTAHPAWAFEQSKKPVIPKYPTGYLWMYVVFVYVFSGLAIYFLTNDTQTIIKVRQEYLGSQSTITDRTIRLSGIPEDLRSEDKIKEFVEELEIGKVESVTLCKHWNELDELMERRDHCIRRLEEAWTVHLGARRVERNLESLPLSQPPPPEPSADQETGDESSHLLDGHEHTVPYQGDRPTTRIWFGYFNLQTKKIDAIDYYEEKLRVLDDSIRITREKSFEPTSLAFVTMDSIAACQMAVQAILDPSPLYLLANPAPAPPDVVWRNTYLSRRSRMIRAWLVTAFVVFLTVVWVFLLAPVAALTSLDSIAKVWPTLAHKIQENAVARSLIQTGLPTLVLSLLTLAVPYLYDWLANLQGMVSQGDIELSVISKNFIFTFFNSFLFFTIIGTASNMWPVLQDSVKDTTLIAFQLARSLDGLALFYVNLIVLQGIGLFPFRLLEFGSVAMYPISLIGAKTPRDYAELVQPPVFKYGFYLPQTILIFIVCIVYSVLPWGVYILFFGLIYFVIGYFTYKYQLLYAMDHPQHSTGQAWSIIVYRVLLGLVVFQLAMAGELAIKKALKRSLLLVPLIFATIWFGYFYRRSYAPLTRFIALRSIQRGSRTLDGQSPTDTVDEEREKHMRYVNPNLVTPLHDVWVAGKTTQPNGFDSTHGNEV